MTDRPTAPTTVVTAVALDLSRFTAAWEHARASIATALQPMVDGVHTLGQALARLIDNMMERANDPAHVAGLEARYYVRGAMDPTYATPEGLRSLVRGILSPDSELAEGLYLMTPANRHLVAVSAMRGWETRGQTQLSSCVCLPCPGRGNDGHRMTHCAECCFGTGVEADLDCPLHGDPSVSVLPLVAHRQWGATRVEVHCG